MSDALKAYVVTEVCDGMGGVVFARFHAQARREGSYEYGDGDWDSVECRRAPEFDQYAPGPVPILSLLEHGWWMECSECQRRIDQEEVEVMRRPPVIIGNTRLFCSPWCRLKMVEWQGQRRADEKLGMTLARMYLPSFCDVLSGTIIIEHGDWRRNRKRKTILGAHFTFPGALHGGGSWREDRRDMAMVSRGDYDIYQTLKEKETAAHGH